MLEGKNIKKYYIIKPCQRIIWNIDEIHRTRPDYIWTANRKIVIQRISGGLTPIVAALDVDGYKTFASVNNLLLKDEYDDFYNYILALLNSKLLNFYYANNFSNRSELTVNISKTFLEKLPVVIPPKNILTTINKAVKDVSNIKHNGNYLNAELEQIKAQKIEDDIDQMVYDLYGLTKEEIAIVEGAR